VQIGCFSACSVDYSGRSGPAVFTQADADNTLSGACTGCGLTMQFTDATSLNVTLEHQGSTGSAAVKLNQ
jgi:hypothetical protein